MKKTLVSALTTALVVGAASTTFAAANPFSDVPADHWAYDAVSQLAADGVIEGYGDATFQGDKNITRYEMAQMVAKAMAKKDVSAADKAMIDKLAAEFSDELNNLGVRVANLEKNADMVKWNGEMRYRYYSDRQDGQKKVNKDLLRFRLNPTAEVNSNWAVHARLDADMNMKNDDTSTSTAKLKRVYAEGKYDNFDIRLGKMGLFSDESEGMTLDDEFSGARVQFGNVLKTTLEAGRWSGIENKTKGTAGYNPAYNDSAANYQGIMLTGEQGKVSGGVAYRHFNSNAFGSFGSYSNNNKEDNADTFNGAIALYIDQLIKSIDEGKLVPTANYNMPEMAHLTVDISDAPRIHFRVNCAPGHEDRLKGLLTFLRHKNVGGYIMNKLEQEYETRSIKIDIRNSYKEVSED